MHAWPSISFFSFSFSFFLLVFSSPHMYPLFSYVSTFFVSPPHTNPILLTSPPPLCLLLCFYFFFPGNSGTTLCGTSTILSSSSAHFTHTQLAMIFWLLLCVCISVFIFFPLHLTSLTHTSGRESWPSYIFDFWWEESFFIFYFYEKRKRERGRKEN